MGTAMIQANKKTPFVTLLGHATQFEVHRCQFSPNLTDSLY